MTTIVPNDRKYSATHQWARAETDGSISVGITDFAQQELGDLVFVEAPAIGRSLVQGEQCGVVESVKSASDLHTPLSGVVSASNATLEAGPEKINDDPYGAWIFRLARGDEREFSALLDAAAYRKLTEG